MAAALERPAIPVKIARYELLAEIASGGMGRVYLARARGPAGFEKLVALKCIHPELSTEQAFVEMFLDEARIAARIDHPNVCRVFDFGESDGTYFIAMEYLVGETATRIARKLAADGPEKIHDAVIARIVAEAAEGLHAAHELADEHGKSLDVVHRDVSPQNLFVTYDGGVHVVDFGIASAQGRLHRTTTGSVKGKIAYMAPEQMRREPIDRRVDVWGLGVVLWEMLTGGRLFRGANELEVMLAVLNDPIPLPTSLRPSIDRELERIVMKALEKDRATRYATARELSAAINRWLVSKGLVVGMAETAAFMATTFPTERAARFELVDRARRAESSDEISVMVVAAENEVPEKSVARTKTDTPGRPRSGSSVGKWIAIVVGVAALIALGWTGARWMTPPAVVAPVVTPTPAVTPAVDRDTTTAAVEPPTPTAPPTPTPSPVAQLPTDEPPPSPTPQTRPRRPDRTPEPPRPPTATGNGHLRVETPGGWADVYLDGRRIGRTPLDRDLPVGRTTIELRPFGLATMSGDATMRRTVTIGERPTLVRVPLGS